MLVTNTIHQAPLSSWDEFPCNELLVLEAALQRRGRREDVRKDRLWRRQVVAYPGYESPHVIPLPRWSMGVVYLPTFLVGGFDLFEQFLVKLGIFPK